MYLGVEWRITSQKHPDLEDVKNERAKACVPKQL